MMIQQNMSVNRSVDHCKTPSDITYQVLSWVMVGEFTLGLPLNLSVLYIFIFRYGKSFYSFTFILVLVKTKRKAVLDSGYWGQSLLNEV